jgi:hypothetical protein
MLNPKPAFGHADTKRLRQREKYIVRLKQVQVRREGPAVGLDHGHQEFSTSRWRKCFTQSLMANSATARARLAASSGA